MSHFTWIHRVFVIQLNNTPPWFSSTIRSSSVWLSNFSYDQRGGNRREQLSGFCSLLLLLSFTSLPPSLVLCELFARGAELWWGEGTSHGDEKWDAPQGECLFRLQCRRSGPGLSGEGLTLLTKSVSCRRQLTSSEGRHKQLFSYQTEARVSTSATNWLIHRKWCDWSSTVSLCCDQIFLRHWLKFSSWPVILSNRQVTAL